MLCFGVCACVYVSLTLDHTSSASQKKTGVVKAAFIDQKAGFQIAMKNTNRSDQIKVKTTKTTHPIRQRALTADW